MIAITISLKETKDGSMTVLADFEGIKPVTIKEHTLYTEVQAKIVKIVEEIAGRQSHSFFAEGDSAEKLFKAMHKKGDRDGG